MNPPRNIPFGSMTSLECLQVLVAGKLPDGKTIDKDTQKGSLARLVPIVKHYTLEDEPAVKEILGQNSKLGKTQTDLFVFVQNHRETLALIQEAEKILSA